MTFQEAVKATPDVSGGYRPGLTALGAYSSKVSVSDTSRLGGSLDIDANTARLYPNDNRWDYAFDYKSKVFFVEVHSANSGEVSVVIRKFNWLKNWLHSKAPEINKLKSTSPQPFYWVQSKNFQIPKNTPQYRAAVNAGLVPIPKLVLQ